MATYEYKTPISENEIRKLKVNDILYLSGILVTARDQIHEKALEIAKEGVSLPVNLEGLAVFHCGPIVAKRNEEWVVIAAGPTTSTRMEPYEDKFIGAFKPRVIIGKGGMGKRTTEAMAKYGAVYCSFTGGAAALAAKAIRRVVDVKWLDLGMSEAMWVFEVEKFGPLVVTIDSFCSNLYAEVADQVEANRRKIFQKLGLYPKRHLTKGRNIG
jgi:fumarate hydratase subunit beta